MTRHDPVLISGCSSGIGAATAAALVEAGHTVYATARRIESLADLEALGCRPLALDVTSEDSMIAAVKAVEAEHGHVGTLINNAGFSEYGPIEESDLGRVRAMFETNVFGLARLTQLVLPAMRRSRSGRIVNIGSMGGRITFPVGGFYHATKYAVEAISDALRVEVKPFGIDVILVEPGLIRTNFESRVNEGLELSAAEVGTAAHDADTAYADLLSANEKNTTGGYANDFIATGPESVAGVIVKALGSSRPRSRYVVTPAAKAMINLRRFGGDRAWDRAMRKQFGR
ncbi:MAG: SDR family NAD(P)-dependent oxidoreductase [Actinobacteria bacterium]|nr:SDR family NAD(P)-dependent oxidoreductase [Actinomycetota bacterium]